MVANHEKIALFDPKQVERFRLQKGDVLAVRGNGNKGLTGLVGMVREDLSRFGVSRLAYTDGFRWKNYYTLISPSCSGTPTTLTPDYYSGREILQRDLED